MMMLKISRLCFSIIGTNVHNLNLILYYIKYKQIKQFKSYPEAMFMTTIPQKQKMENELTQMQKLIEAHITRIAIVNNKAYWVKNNTIFSSDLDSDGSVDMDTASEIDVFSLSEKETKNLLKIIDSLSE